MDRATGRQMRLLGEIRGGALSRRFALATKENGFFSPIEEEMHDAVRHLDGVGVGASPAMEEEELAAALEARLGLREA